MKILILEDEQRKAKRLIRLLNDIDRTFIVEGPLASIKETVEFFQSGKTTDLIPVSYTHLRAHETKHQRNSRILSIWQNHRPHPC